MLNANYRLTYNPLHIMGAYILNNNGLELSGDFNMSANKVHLKQQEAIANI